MSFRTINPEVKVSGGVKELPRSTFQAARGATPRWTEMKPSVLRPSGGGWEHSIGDEIVFTVCRKLITRNKLISRYSFRINCIFTEVTASDGSSSSDKGWTHKGGGWHGGEGGGRYWMMKLIGAMALLPDALDNSVRSYLKRSFVVALIAAKVFLSRNPPPPPRCARSICWGSCLSRMAQCTLTARLLFLHHVTVL